jgi:O-acetyl-ADP-ribose deacetylase (regulator of RNase III)
MSQTLQNRIEIEKGDITRLKVDAIVNAANTSLLGGGGVDGAIHRAAGPQLLEECKTLGGCSTGSAKITRGYDLPATHVIHAVGPVYKDGKSGEAEKLAGCYRTSLKLAVENNCKSIAFPAISCGVYGYPVEEAARVAFGEVIDFLQNDAQLERVVFVLFDDKSHRVYKNVYEDMLE